MRFSQRYRARGERHGLRPLLGAAVLVVLAVVLVCLRYPRQIVSHLTHWRTGPKPRNSYVVHRPVPAARLAFAGDVRHFVEVAVLADRLVVRAIDQQQRVFDELVLSPRDRTAMRGSVAPGS